MRLHAAQGQKKRRSRGSSSTSSAARKKQASAAKTAANTVTKAAEEQVSAAEANAKAAEQQVAVLQAANRAAHSYHHKVLIAHDIQRDPGLVPEGYLSHPVVCGMDDDGNPNPPLAASDLVLIDQAVLLLAYMSSAGSTDQTLIGCRQVSYFKPLKIAVLNTTVIFEDYEHQKNLDPLLPTLY